MITKENVSQKIYDYLNQSISVDQLIDWAENVLMEEDVDEKDAEVISDVVAQLGLADATNFGLSWEDCAQLLKQLGYHISFNLEKVS